MTQYEGIVDRVISLEGANAHDSFISGSQPDAQEIGQEWVQLTGFVVGPQNYDNAVGPDVELNDDTATFDLVLGGRYGMSLNAQFQSAEADGWFELAIEPNGLSLSEDLWPADAPLVGHVGTYLDTAVFSWDGCEPGTGVGYTSPRLLDGATITAWARFATASGTDTCSIKAVLFLTRITA